MKRNRLLNSLLPNMGLVNYVAEDEPGGGTPPPPVFDSDSFRKSNEPGLDDKSPLPPKDVALSPPLKDDSITSVKKDIPSPVEVTYKHADLWDVMKEELSTTDHPWDIPEQLKTGKKEDGTVLTKKEELALMRKVINENTEFDDEFVNEYLEAKESGIPVDQFIKNKSNVLDFASMNVDDKVRLYFEDYAKANKLEWSKEIIDAKIEKMDPVDKDMQAKVYENYLNVKDQAINNEYITTANTKFEQSYTKAETENIQLINNYLKNIEGKDTIEGIEFGQAEKTQYIKDLPTFMKREIKIDEKTGMKYAISSAERLLSEVLAKPESTMALLPYLWKMNNGTLQGYTRTVKEKIKESLEKTLDNQPDVAGVRSGVTGFNSQGFREGK